MMAHPIRTASRDDSEIKNECAVDVGHIHITTND
jgi:hypothetical protein